MIDLIFRGFAHAPPWPADANSRRATKAARSNRSSSLCAWALAAAIDAVTAHRREDTESQDVPKH